ncbi:MAG: HK97 family phage prohead protease [Pseudomonadota bacterium]
MSGPIQTLSLRTAVIEGYAARFGAADLNGDIIAPGAFRKTLRKRNAPVRMLYQHDAAAPIGRWTELFETPDGLFARGVLLLDSPRARELHSLLVGGAIDGLSIGFETVRARKCAGRRGRNSVQSSGRNIVELNLWEISIVTFPMAPNARVLRVGAAEPLSKDLLHAVLPPARSVRENDVSPLPSLSLDRRAPGLPQPGARHFADALRRATSILSV